jgi:hypothetical protein
MALSAVAESDGAVGVDAVTQGNHDEWPTWQYLSVADRNHGPGRDGQERARTLGRDEGGDEDGDDPASEAAHAFVGSRLESTSDSAEIACGKRPSRPPPRGGGQ